MIYMSSVTASDFHPDTRAFFAGRKVLVLGGSGFVGSHVVEQLLELSGHPIVLTRKKTPEFLRHLSGRVELLHGSILDNAIIHAATAKASVVLNLAAEVAGLEWNASHPASIFMNNISVFIESMRAAAHHSVDRYLVTSSACVYPRNCSIPTPEAEGTKDEPEPTNAGYGWAKRMEEFLGKAAASEFGLSVSIARPYNAYGPRDNFSTESSHVIPALVTKAVDSKTGEFPVWGDGSHSRDFLYVDDFARGLLEVAARYPQADPVNLGAARECTIKELANIIAEEVSELSGRNVRPHFQPNGLTGQPRRASDTRKAFEALNFQATTPLRAGLRKTIEWYMSNAHRTGDTHP